jgi:RecB family exonuclease
MPYRPPCQRNLYDPESEKPFKLSRTRLDRFIECPRCFYLDRRLGVDRPPGFPFNLNSAVDALLKTEFDIYREQRKPHPHYMQAHGIDAVPFQHPELNDWRNNFKGVQHLHEPTNLLIHGAVDDVWQAANGELIVVDYKATSKNSAVSLDAEWQRGYKRQLEIYQWLLRRNGFTVSDTGYFIYCNGDRRHKEFAEQMQFMVSVLPYTGSDAWIEETILDAHHCLHSDSAPPLISGSCDYCAYHSARIAAG